MGHGHDYGPSAIHGPDMSRYHDSIHSVTENDRQIFDYLLKPDDSYGPNGAYWADMPLMQRVRFVMSYDAQEAKREMGNIWAMTKKDPLSPLGYYVSNMVIPGAGLGLEGYGHKVTDGKLAPLTERQLRALLHW